MSSASILCFQATVNHPYINMNVSQILWLVEFQGPSIQGLAHTYLDAGLGRLRARHLCGTNTTIFLNHSKFPTQKSSMLQFLFLATWQSVPIALLLKFYLRRREGVLQFRPQMEHLHCSRCQHILSIRIRRLQKYEFLISKPPIKSTE